MEPRQRALQVINQNAEQIADVGDSIWSFAEIGMQEYETDTRKGTTPTLR
jgi:metal-dependent amidase/aminoacylase/carboxypeptidase family protein